MPADDYARRVAHAYTGCFVSYLEGKAEHFKECDELAASPNFAALIARVRSDTLEEAAKAYKAAFWSKFHQVGEVWFDYLGPPEEREACTQWEWDDFLECDAIRALKGSKP